MPLRREDLNLNFFILDFTNLKKSEEWFVGAISLGRMVVPSLKIVMNLPGTYEKLLEVMFRKT